MKKAIVLVLSLILAMGLFASCGGGGGGEDTEGKTSLTIAVDNDYDTLHPANWSTTVENRLDYQIYDTLLRKTTRIRPNLNPA